MQRERTTILRQILLHCGRVATPTIWMVVFQYLAVWWWLQFVLILNATDMRECVLCGRRTVRNELYKRSKYSIEFAPFPLASFLTFRSLFGKELNFSNTIFPRKPCILYKPHINQIYLLLHMVHALKVLTLHSLLRLFLYLQGCMRLYLLLQCLLFQVQ